MEAANSRALEAQRLQDDAEKASTKADRKLKESAKEVKNSEVRRIVCVMHGIWNARASGTSSVSSVDFRHILYTFAVVL